MNRPTLRNLADLSQILGGIGVIGVADTGFGRFQVKAGLWPDSLDALGQRRWDAYLSATFRHFENIHYQHRSGLLADDVWIGYDRQISGTVARPGYGRWFVAHADQSNAPFRDYILGAVADPRPFGPMFAPVGSLEMPRLP